jgi:hypothetical protein
MSVTHQLYFMAFETENGRTRHSLTIAPPPRQFAI